MKEFARQIRRHWRSPRLLRPPLHQRDPRRTQRHPERQDPGPRIQEHGLLQHHDLPDLRQTRPQQSFRPPHTKQRKADFLAIAEAADPLRASVIAIPLLFLKPSLPPSVPPSAELPLSERSQNHLKFLEIRPADAYAKPCSPQQPAGPAGPGHRRTPSSHDQSCHRSAADWR